MKIKKVEIANYKCLGPTPISFFWEDIVVLVGENNVGKSSILEAVDLYFANKKKLESKYFYNAQSAGAEPEPIEIIITFSGLTPTECALRGVNKRLASDGDWVLKKVYNYIIGDTSSDDVKYFSFSKALKVADINTNTTWDRVRELYPEIEVSGTGKKLNTEDVAEIAEQVATHYPERVTLGANDEWVSNPGGRQSNIEKILKDNISSVFIRAVHPVKEETAGSKGRGHLQRRRSHEGESCLWLGDSLRAYFAIVA